MRVAQERRIVGAMDDLYDVAVVGGGPAGLNGALMLARSRRSVVVIDAGEPRNAPAAAVHGFFTRDGTPPQELLAAGRAEVAAYGVDLVDGTVVEASRDGAPAEEGPFRLALADGTELAARRLLLTTGLVDELPEVKGVQALWGGDVVHCPYCHGWEVRDRAIGVLASSPMATHQALLFRQLSDDVVVFSHTAPPSDEQRVQLAARDIEIVDGVVSELEIEGGRLQAVVLEGGDRVEREVVSVQPRFVARSQLLSSLGVEVVDEPPMGLRVVSGAFGQTNVPGVWVAGNVTDLSAQVVVAAAAGAMAGARLNAELVEDEVLRAVAVG